MQDSQQAQDQWVQRVLGIAMETQDRSTLIQRRAELEPKFNAALRASPDESAALSGAWAMVQQLAAAGETDRAEAALTRLREQIDHVLAHTPQTQAGRLGIPEGLVARRRAELEELMKQEVDGARDIVSDQFGALAPELDDLIETPQAITAAMDKYFAELFARVQAGLDAAVLSEDTDEIQKQVTALRAGIAADQRLAALDEVANAFDLEFPTEIIESLFDEVLASVERAAQ